MENKVSVVVPVYNTKRYLKECVDSITEQTYCNIEILLVDDGSTDGSAALCDELSCRDERIRVIHKTNGGAATARNLGIDEATGEYIMFIDSDDWLDTNAIQTLVEHADRNKTDVIRFNYIREYEGKSLPKKNTFLEARVYSGEECKIVRRQILGLTGNELSHPENMKFLASCCVNIYRSEVLKTSGARFVPIQKIGAFVDGLFNFCAFSHVKCFEFIDKPYYHYRKTNESAATANYRKNYISRQLTLFEILKETIDAENAWEFYREAFRSHLVYATMEIAFNAMRNKAPFQERYREIKAVLNHPLFCEAYREFNLKNIAMKWKVYFYFIKHSMPLPMFIMTWIVWKLKSKGVA